MPDNDPHPAEDESKIVDRVTACAGEILLALSQSDVSRIAFFGRAFNLDEAARGLILEGSTNQVRRMNAISLVYAAIDFLTSPAALEPAPKQLERSEREKAVRATVKRLKDIQPLKSSQNARRRARAKSG